MSSLNPKGTELTLPIRSKRSVQEVYPQSSLAHRLLHVNVRSYRRLYQHPLGIGMNHHHVIMVNHLPVIMGKIHIRGYSKVEKYMIG
jgi:hypothetical protein